MASTKPRTLPGKPSIVHPPPGKPIITGTLWPSGVRLGFIIISTLDGDLSFTCELDADQWKQDGGVGEYDDTERPKRRKVLIYKGVSRYTIQVPINFEGFKAKKSQEDDIKMLERMAVPLPGDDQPPRVLFDAGGGVPHDHTHDPLRQWVITQIAHGAALYNDSAQRVRQSTVVTFDEWSADPLLDTDIGQHGKYKRYTVVKGDTLKKIAKRKLGNAKRYKELAALNQIRDGNHLVPGSILLIPKK